MKKLMSINYSDTAFNVGVFVLRVTTGLMMFINHGIGKLTNFNVMQTTFPDPLHIGHRWSLVLSILAEVFGSLLLVIGLFSRIAALLLVVDLAVALIFVHWEQPVKNFEIVIVFLSAFFFQLLAGPGKYSMDAMVGK
jgi:putative oxidoreductase